MASRQPCTCLGQLCLCGAEGDDGVRKVKRGGLYPGDLRGGGIAASLGVVSKDRLEVPEGRRDPHGLFGEALADARVVRAAEGQLAGRDAAKVELEVAEELRERVVGSPNGVLCPFRCVRLRPPP